LSSLSFISSLDEVGNAIENNFHYKKEVEKNGKITCKQAQQVSIRALSAILSCFLIKLPGQFNTGETWKVDVITHKHLEMPHSTLLTTS